MSGFGIREQYAAGVQLADVRLWRDSSFLHQLSRNGSLLLACNHDRFWLDALVSQLGSEGRGWTWHANLMRVLPAAVVRRILWRTSVQWWHDMLALRGQLAIAAAEHGLVCEGELAAFNRRLEIAAELIDELSWCATDDDRGLIEVIERT